jgi:hypothetical protein
VRRAGYRAGPASQPTGVDPKRWQPNCFLVGRGEEIMADASVSFEQEAGNESLTSPEINALLFRELGQFVVWGCGRRDLAASDSKFSALLETATRALSRGGIRET